MLKMVVGHQRNANLVFGKTHPSPTAGVNGSGGSDFNRCADGLVGVKDLRKQ